VSNSFRGRKQNAENAMKQFGQIKTVLADRMPPNKKTAADFRRGLYDIRDDVDMPLICPTRQAQKQFGLAHRQSNGLVGRRAAQ
jgi:hypothetical protein